MTISPIIERSYDFVGSLAIGAKLATDQEIADIKGIFGYADREGFLGSIATLLHRVWNAVKALFGQSDWQRAERALKEVAVRCIDKFAPPEAVVIAKAAISGGIPSEVADDVIDQLNKVNKDAREIEKKILPLFDRLLPLIDGEKIGVDLANGIVPQELIESYKELSAEEQYSQLVGYALDREYIKPEARIFFTERLPITLRHIGQAQLAQRVQSM